MPALDGVERKFVQPRGDLVLDRCGPSSSFDP
jgi:hypothetical protein